MSELNVALAKVELAAGQIFDADQSVRSVGVGKSADGYGFVAVRNILAPVPFKAKLGGGNLPTLIDGISVEYTNSRMDPVNFARVPHTGPASPGIGSVISEQQSHSMLVCGLQIQNFDNDVRSGDIGRGYIVIGTLGCFVQVNGGIGILSNNHVVAGENQGVIGTDRILQPGSSAFSASSHVATLSGFVGLKVSPANSSIAAGTVVLNDIDAGIADLQPGIGWSQSYLPGRAVAAPHGVANPTVGDRVHKVGRTTGLTFGTVKQIGVVVGPIDYEPGPCWFRQCIVIEGDNGTTFSDHGDSGSAIVRDDGTVIGLLYAGNGTQTYACSISNVMQALNCILA